MIRHIVTWNFKEGFTPEENRYHAQKVKQELEGLSGLIEGIVSFEVIVNTLASSNRDIVLNSEFTSEETLADYQVHPEHIRVSNYVGTVMMNRTCIDFVE